MKKQAVIAVIMFLGCTIACAGDAPGSPVAKPEVAPVTPPSDPGSFITKSEWLNTIVPLLPSLICKGFMNDPSLKEQLDLINMNDEQCVRIIPDSVRKCQNQLDTSIPEKINTSDTVSWGKKLGECIGKDFAMTHFLPK